MNPRITTLLATLTFALAMVGCNKSNDTYDPLRVSYPKDSGASTAQTRVHFELVPNARLVTEDTRPAWELGRHAYVPGDNRLLVVTRITSYAKRDQKGKPLPGDENRYDKIIERFWLTIPPDLPVGQTLDFTDLEKDLLLGYDRKNVGEPYYIYGCSARGKITILEEKAGSVAFDFNAVVEPFQHDKWGVNGLQEVTYSLSGIYANQPAPSALQRYLIRKGASSNADSAGELRIPNANMSDASVDPDMVQVSIPEAPGDVEPADAGDATSSDTADASDTEASGEIDAKALVGKWRGKPERGWEYLFQFNADGTFNYNMSRGGRPYVYMGRYRVQGNYLILNVEMGGSGGDPMAPYTKDGRIATARVGLANGKMSFNAKALPGAFHEGIPRAVAMTMSAADFPDLRYTHVSGTAAGGYKYGKHPQR